VTVDDKYQLNCTVTFAANLNCHDHVTCFFNISFSNCLNVINRLFKIKDDILLVT